MTWGEVVAIVGGGVLPILGALFWGCRVGWHKVVKPGISRTRTAIAVLSEFSKVQALLLQIDKELHPNGGSSTRDVLDECMEYLRRAESRQIIGEQKYRAMLSNASYAVFEADSHGECTWVNATYRNLVGKSLEEMQGNGWVNALVPEDREDVYDAWMDAVKQRRDFAMNYRMLDYNDKSILVRCRATHIVDVDGTLAGFFGTITLL